MRSRYLEGSASGPFSIRMMAILLLCGVLLVASPIAFGDEQSDVRPVLRFSFAKDRTPTSEYIGKPDGAYAEQFEEYTVAEGRMQLDCSDVAAIGIALEAINIGGWHYGSKTKYRFEWSHTGVPDKTIKRMRYKEWRRTGFIQERLGFERKYDGWLVDGILKLTVTVRGTMEFETEFELKNCPPLS